MIKSTTLVLIFLLSLASIVMAQQKEIEVSTYYSKVYVAPSTNANFVGLIQKGERYPIIAARDNWYNIRFKNVNGWIHSSQARVVGEEVAAPEVASSEDKTTEELRKTEENADSGAISSSAVVEQTRSNNSEANPRSSSSSATSGESRSSVSRTTRPSNPTVTASVPTPPVEKKESKIKSWFTQKNIPELPASVNPNVGRDEPIVSFQVTYPSGVRKFLDPESPILGMTKRGQLLQLVGRGDSWCKVVFADTIGWVESKHGKIVDPSASSSLDYVKIGLFAGGILLLLIVLILIIRKFRKNPLAAVDDGGVRKNVLIVSRSAKTIQYTLTNGTTPLDRCFTEVGFEVKYVKEGAAIKNSLQQKDTDIIMIDYKFDGSIIPFMEKVCSSLGIAESVLTIAYNVPDAAAMQPGKVLDKMMFLGTSFSDRDIFKLITPMLRSTGGEHIQKSSHSSALAGNIGAGNLLEILQFIEIGSKTGCLLIELDKPFAIICFKSGRINFAATADKITGREAIFKVLELKDGKFRFVLNKKPKVSNINLSTLEILMEWTKAIDEAHVN